MGRSFKNPYQKEFKTEFEKKQKTLSKRKKRKQLRNKLRYAIQLADELKKAVTGTKFQRRLQLKLNKTLEYVLDD